MGSAIDRERRVNTVNIAERVWRHGRAGRAGAPAAIARDEVRR